MNERRTDLLRRVTDYLLANGVASLSLRRLAPDLGTSARMLVYHFGSRDGLITAAMDEVRARFQAAHEEAFARPRKRGRHPLLVFWDTLTSSANLPYVRLLLEVQVLALQDPNAYARYLDQTSTGWLDLIESKLALAIRSRAAATLCSAVVDGLVLEVLSTGDRRRATDALSLFLEQLHGASRRAARCRPRRRAPRNPGR